MVDPSKKALWLLRTHHTMRVSSFATVFVASCIHITGKGYSPGAWAYLVALLLVYPQLLYWRTLRSPEPVSAALKALLFDSMLLGAYCATIQFSDWLTFSVVLGTMSNSAANKGWRSTGVTLLALGAGALTGVAVGGFYFVPHTEWQTALFCMIGLGAYELAVGHLTYFRTVQLRSTRELLRARERDLLEANATLHTSLTEIEALRKGLVEQANQDGLTKLFNRRFLDSTLERELARCQRESKPLTLIMLDLDHFKKYNDAYGHQAGDECLKAVAHALQGSAKRAGDLAARYGGEEFSLVLPDTDGVDGLRLAEELRQEIEALAMPHAKSDQEVVTISAGLAVMAGGSYASAEQLVRAADEALYYAKWGGRNRVHVAPDSSRSVRMETHMPGSLMPLHWRSTYACGNTEIDAQHEQLFRQVNEVLTTLTEGREADSIHPLIDHLMRNVVVHFEHEEALLESIGYPEAAAHAAQHRTLLSRAVDLVSQQRKGDLRIGELLDYLAQDLIAKHILGADRRYCAYLKD